MSQVSNTSASSSNDDPNLRSDASLKSISIDLVQAIVEQRLRLEDQDRSIFTTQNAKDIFIAKLHEEYDIKSRDIEEAIVKITPYVALRRWNNHGVTYSIMSLSTVQAAPILRDEYNKPMADIFPNARTHGLLLFETRDRLANDPKFLTEIVDKQESDLDELESLISSTRARMNKKQEEAKAERERLEERSRLAEVAAKADREAAKADREAAKADRERFEERLRLAEVAAKADRERFEEVILTLQKDLEDERVRVQGLEDTVDGQADKIRDFDEFIANGCKEDTAAYNRIKLRHLLNLTQARLAYCTGLATPADDRGAPLKWRAYCNTLKDKKGPNGQTITRVMQAEKLIRVKRSKDDEHSTEALITSGALVLLVDDLRIRRLSDYDAHPGPLQNENVDGYRFAVKSHAEDEGDQVLASHLTACLTFMLPQESSS